MNGTLHASEGRFVLRFGPPAGASAGTAASAGTGT